MKGKSRKDNDLASNLLVIMSALEEQADKRMEEREAKRMRMEASMEEARREQERKHEERMQNMLFGFLQTMMAGSNSHLPQPPNPMYPPGPTLYSSHPSFSPTPPFPSATSDSSPVLFQSPTLSAPTVQSPTSSEPIYLPPTSGSSFPHFAPPTSSSAPFTQ